MYKRQAQLKEQVGYYMSNAKAIYEGLASAGYSVSGGVNAPYTVSYTHLDVYKRQGLWSTDRTDMDEE